MKCRSVYINNFSFGVTLCISKWGQSISTVTDGGISKVIKFMHDWLLPYIKKAHKCYLEEHSQARDLFHHLYLREAVDNEPFLKVMQ